MGPFRSLQQVRNFLFKLEGDPVQGRIQGGDWWPIPPPSPNIELLVFTQIKFSGHEKIIISQYYTRTRYPPTMHALSNFFWLRKTERNATRKLCILPLC